MSTLREQLLNTALSFIKSFNEFTPESVVRFRNANCVHKLRPGSINEPPRTNAEYSAFCISLLGVMRGFTLHLQDGYQPIIDEVSHKVTLYLRSTCETDLGEYAQEYIWILSLDDKGTGIDEIIEFADSAYTLEWFVKLREAAQQKGT